MVTKVDAKEWAHENVKGLWGIHWATFDKNDRLDEDQLVTHVRRVLDQPLQGLSAGGMLCELAYLSIAERKRILEIVAAEAVGKMPAYFSATLDSLPDTIDLVKFGADLGYDIAMIWVPYEHAKSEDQMFDFYRMVDASTPIAVSAYSTPHSGRLMSPELVARISKLESVCVLKYVSWDFPSYVRATELVGEDCVISYPLEDKWLISQEHFGNQALYSTTAANLYGNAKGINILADYTKLAQEGRWAEAHQVSASLDPLRALWAEIYSVYQTEHRHPYAETKYWAKAVGLLDEARARAPQPQVSDETAAQIDAALSAAGLV